MGNELNVNTAKRFPRFNQQGRINALDYNDK